MRNRDYTPPLSRCISCGKLRLLVPGQPVCHSCDLKLRSRQAGKQRYSASSRAGTPKPSKLDLEILNRLAGNSCSPIYLYTQAWHRQDGKCARCGKRHQTLRVRPDYSRRAVKRLICSKCFVRKSRTISTKPKVLSLTEQVWDRADSIMRFQLSLNPEFMNELTKQSS